MTPRLVAFRLCALAIPWSIIPADGGELPLVSTYDWPTGPGEAVASDKYSVRLRCGDLAEEIEVQMSTGWTEPGGGPDVFRGRSFSWATFSAPFDEPVTVEVRKLFGNGSQDVEVFPSGYEIEAVPNAEGDTVTFELTQSRYVSVNFKSADNQHTPDGVVRHMLMIFADPPEEDVPDPKGASTHVFGSSTTAADIAAANLVYFPPGFHDLTLQLPNGFLELRSGLKVYLAGGAFVVGKMVSTGTADGCSIRGRGALSGRAWMWAPGGGESLIHTSGTGIEVEGIHVFDSDFHGVVPGHAATIQNVKMWGWHYNNDGFRPWGGTVKHCFLRPVDDAFYVGGNRLVVEDTVVWQSFNGAVVTCGWGSAAAPYDTTDFVMKDCHILYPEWNGIGNNNGLLASQLPYSASSSDIHFEDIRVDGNVCAITNLKRNEALAQTGAPGGISNVSFKNLVVTGSQLVYNHDRTSVSGSKSSIRGENGFTIGDVHFDNVMVDGTFITEANKDSFFTIDPVTTYDITFSSGAAIESVGIENVHANTADLWVDLSGFEANRVDLRVFWGEQDQGETPEAWPNASDPLHPDLSEAQGGRRHQFPLAGLTPYRKTVFRWLLDDGSGNSVWTAARTFRSFEPSGGTGPDGIPGCLLWLEPESVVTVSEDGNHFVESWLDRSTGRAVTAPGADRRPLLSSEAMGGRAAVHFDGGDALVAGGIREATGGGIVYVLSQCLTNPASTSWPRLVTSAPDGGVPWITPGWQMVAPGSSASGGSIYNPTVSFKTLSAAVIENTTIGARPDFAQPFRGEIGSVLIFDAPLTMAQQHTMDWYFDRQTGTGMDSDGDGLIDSWERLHFGGITITDANSDEDGDFLDNAGEQLWGYDPQAGQESARTSAELVQTADGLVLRWLAREGRRYEVVAGEDPDAASDWTSVQGLEELLGIDGWIEIPVTPTLAQRKFFKIKVSWP